MTSGRRVSRAGLLAVALTILLATAGPAPGQAEEPDADLGSSSAFEVSAAAEGFRLGVRAPNYAIVEQFVDVGAPVAQALVDSIGNSRAFASHPYPGDLVITGPGTFSGLTGTPKLGDYPLYAASNYPAVPETTVSQPGYELSAHSEETASRSQAQSGGSSGDSAGVQALVRSSASHDPDSGVLEAAATSTVTGFEVGGVLQIGKAVAMAKVSRPLGGELTRESSFVADAVSIGGQSVMLSEQGVTIPGGGVPLPDSSPVLEALRQAQITVTYLRGSEDSEGVVSPGLLISQTTSIPSGPNIIVTLVLGRATAHAGGQVVASAPPAGGSEVPAGVDPEVPEVDAFSPAPSPTEPPPAPTNFSEVPDAEGVGSLPPGVGVYLPADDLDPADPNLDLGDPVGPEAALDVAGAATSAPPPASSAAPAVSSASLGGPRASTSGLYLMVVVGALLAGLGAQLVRTRAVRWPWSS